MSYKEYNIEKPYIKDNKWLIFNNTIFADLDLMDCNDTINGMCYENKTFNECVQMCNDSAECDAGYFIKGFNNDICVPLKTTAYKGVNPVYRLRDKNIYPVLNNKPVSTFINKNNFPFPLLEANIVFFMDNLNIKNIESGLTIETSTDEENTEVKFSTDGDLKVQLLPTLANITIGVNYTPVKYGDLFAINIPGTSLVLRKSQSNFKNNLEWVPKKEFLTTSTSFSIVPIMPNKKIGDQVLYSDKFSIKYAMTDLIFTTPTDHFASVYYGTYKDALEKHNYVTFSFIPQMKGYYCNNKSECTEIELKNMDVNEKGIGTYDGLGVGRNPGCWGVCNYKIPNQAHLYPFEEHQETKNLNIQWTWVFISIIISVVLVASEPI